MAIMKYEHIPIEESNEPLVNLKLYGFKLDPVYYNAGLSDSPVMYLRISVAERLEAVREELAPLNVKIWDGWRSRNVQQKLYLKYWKEIEIEHPVWPKEQLRKQVGTFVTIGNDPKRIPLHATGGSVDLTLVNEFGVDLDMGTGFDHFGPEAASLYYEQGGRNLEAACSNRRILREALTSVGFRCDDDEWWHFDYGNQIWAASLGKSHAFYGEASTIDGGFNKPYAID
jgi:D-alanyl-D-alanine dipeptidase